MSRIAGLNFRNGGKIYYFDTEDLDVHMRDKVIAETSRGKEFGTVMVVLDSEQISLRRSPLKGLLRIATEEDLKREEENLEKEDKAFHVCKDKIEEHGLEMKLVDAEYTFDNSKLIFYFTADGRVDFRNLVKDLAGIFRTRIELRQIGIRDKAKEYNIEIVENKPLARLLYHNVEVGDEIPQELYQAVAEVLAAVYRIKNKL